MAKATTKEPAVVHLYEIKLDTLSLYVRGVGASLICHRFSERNVGLIEAKQQKLAPQAKEARDPEREMRDALYLDEHGAYCFPAVAFKNAIVSACRHTDITMTKARGAFHVLGDLLPLENYDGPHLRRDRVVIGRGTTSIAYRPEFREWEVELQLRYSAAALSGEQLVNLVEIAGFAVGVGDWRPERNGSHGMFEVKR